MLKAMIPNASLQDVERPGGLLAEQYLEASLMMIAAAVETVTVEDKSL